MSLPKKNAFQAQGMHSFRDYYVNNKASFRTKTPAASSSIVGDARPTVSLTGVMQGRLSLAGEGVPALSLTGVMQGRLSLTPTG